MNYTKKLYFTPPSVIVQQLWLNKAKAKANQTIRYDTKNESFFCPLHCFDSLWSICLWFLFWVKQELKEFWESKRKNKDWIKHKDLISHQNIVVIVVISSEKQQINFQLFYSFTLFSNSLNFPSIHPSSLSRILSTQFAIRPFTLPIPLPSFRLLPFRYLVWSVSRKWVSEWIVWFSFPLGILPSINILSNSLFGLICSLLLFFLFCFVFTYVLFSMNT